MSVHVLSWVLKHSEATLADRLVLLVLADHAKEDGTASWPSVATIANEARISERKAQYALRALEAAGSIRATGKSKNGTTVYDVVMGGADSAGVQNRAAGGAKVAPEPSLEQPSGPPQPSVVVADPAEATTQTILASVVDGFRTNGIPITARHRGMLAKQIHDCLTSGFENELIVVAAVTAIRRGEPQNMHFIANDLATAKAGQRVTRREYERALQDAGELGIGASLGAG